MTAAHQPNSSDLIHETVPPADEVRDMVRRLHRDDPHGDRVYETMRRRLLADLEREGLL